MLLYGMDDGSSQLSELLANLVQIETENPPGNEQLCAEFIGEWFEERDIKAHLIDEPDPNRPQVVARVGESDPTIVLNGHIDVVPAGNHSNWQYDPYNATISDGDLFGRGSVDMKAGIALAMLATQRLGEELEHDELPGSVVFHAAIGEETGDPGTKTLLEAGYDGDYGVVLEPTSLRTATRTKGTAWYKITVTGNPSHASRPDQGESAIANAIPVYDRLVEYGDEMREREDELLGPSYATVTQFNAGTAKNVLPENATLMLDRRVLPDEEFEEVNREIDTLLSGLETEHEIQTDWELVETLAPSTIPDDSNLAKTFRQRSADVAGVSTEPWAIPAATDMRNFVNDAGTEAITWGPGDIRQAHTFDEHIDLGEATTGLEILEGALRELLT